MMNSQNLICITCPRGCSLTVSYDDQDQMIITGNHCLRGTAYAKAELTDPRRMIASTVRIHGGIHKMLPVSTNAPFPKAKIMDLMALLKSIEIDAPVKMGDVLIENVLGTGIAVIASRSMNQL
jgi:CxxC motif-containing protein